MNKPDLMAELAEFADAVERLAFSMPAPNQWTPLLVAMSQEAKRRIATHHAELEAAVRDAARYRWLREADWGRRALSVPYVLAGKNFAESDERLAGEAMDAAIDQAMHNSAREG